MTIVPRGKGTQRENEIVLINPSQLLLHLIICAAAVIPHIWNWWWNAHHRRRQGLMFEADTLYIATDFSAVISHILQDKINSHVPAHSNLAVYIVSHSPRIIILPNGEPKRVQDNDTWYFASNHGEILKSNSFYHRQCCDTIMKHYYDIGLTIRHVNMFTDGCGGQYKGRRNVWSLSTLLSQFQPRGLLSFVHSFAPTATFKGMWDAAGYKYKEAVEKRERDKARR